MIGVDNFLSTKLKNIFKCLAYVYIHKTKRYLFIKLIKVKNNDNT